MNKKYTDIDIQKMLRDMSELMPEINPNDSEWKEFLKEFIAARPKAKLDPIFAKEIRHKLLEKAAGIHTPKRVLIPRWMKFAAPLTLGAAVCAVVIVPMLKTPELVQTKDAHFSIPAVVQIEEKGIQLVFDETSEIQEVTMTPMMAQELTPIVQEIVPVEYEDEVVAAPEESLYENEAMAIAEEGPLYLYEKEDVVIPAEPKETERVSAPTSVPKNTDKPANVDNVATRQVPDVHKEPVFSSTTDGSMTPDTLSFFAEPATVPLRWEDVPSDVDILLAATTFVTQQGTAIEQKPFINKWWETKSTGISEFAPDYFEVIFPQNNGGEIRVEVNIRTMEVVKLN